MSLWQLPLYEPQLGSAGNPYADRFFAEAKVPSHHRSKLGCWFGWLADYETLLKSYQKAHQVVEQEGVPNFFVRALVELETFVEEKHKDKENFKKLSRAKALALNTLRAKVRKTTEPWAASIADCKENPDKFETQSEDSDEADVSL